MASFSISASKIGAGLQEDFTPRRSSELTDLSVAGAPGNAVTGVGNATIQFAKVQLADKKRKHLNLAKRNFAVESTRLITEANERHPFDPRTAQSETNDPIMDLVEQYSGGDPDVAGALTAEATIFNLENRQKAAVKARALAPANAKLEAELSFDAIMTTERNSSQRQQKINDFRINLHANTDITQGMRDRIERDTLHRVEQNDYSRKLDSANGPEDILRKGMDGFVPSLLSDSEQRSILSSARTILNQRRTQNDLGISDLIASVPIQLKPLLAKIKINNDQDAVRRGRAVIANAVRRLNLTSLKTTNQDRYNKLALTLEEDLDNLRGTIWAADFTASTRNIVPDDANLDGITDIFALRGMFEGYMAKLDDDGRTLQSAIKERPEWFAVGEGVTRQRAIEKAMKEEGLEISHLMAVATGRLKGLIHPAQVSVIRGYINDVGSVLAKVGIVMPREKIDKEMKSREEQLFKEDLIRVNEEALKRTNNSIFTPAGKRNPVVAISEADTARRKRAIEAVVRSYPGLPKAVAQNLIKDIDDESDFYAFNFAKANGIPVTPEMMERVYGGRHFDKTMKNGQTISYNQYVGAAIKGMDMESEAYQKFIGEMRDIQSRSGVFLGSVENTLTDLVDSKDSDSLLRAARMAVDLGGGSNIRAGSREAGSIVSKLAVALSLVAGSSELEASDSIKRSMGYMVNRGSFALSHTPVTSVQVLPFVQKSFRSLWQTIVDKTQFGANPITPDPPAKIEDKALAVITRLANEALPPHDTAPEDILEAKVTLALEQVQGRMSLSKYGGGDGGEVVVWDGYEAATAKGYLTQSEPSEWAHNALGRSIYSDVIRRGIFSTNRGWTSALLASATDFFKGTKSEENLLAEIGHAMSPQGLWERAKRTMNGERSTEADFFIERIMEEMRDNGDITVTRLPLRLSPNGDPVFEVTYRLGTQQYRLKPLDKDGNQQDYFSPSFAGTPEAAMEYANQKEIQDLVHSGAEFIGLRQFGLRLEEVVRAIPKFREQVMRKRITVRPHSEKSSGIPHNPIPKKQ
jgi:hypothetical protein